MEESKKSSGKAIVIVLAVLLLAALAYMFYNKNEHKKLTDAIEEEKEEIELNLDSMIVKYEDAISQNTSMSNELAFERDRIIAMRDSIKDLKATNYNLIRRYRKQVANLEETNRRLFFMTDSLTSLNELLNIDLDSAQLKITQQLAMNDTLTLENEGLLEKVAIGSILKVNTGNIVAMRERSNGKFAETTRARNTDAFRINFTIAKNEISEEGEREVFIQLIDGAGNVIANKGEATLMNATINFSDQTTVNYMKEDLDVISLIEVDRDDIRKGEILANIFVGDSFVKGIRILLK